jgi:hypothetical protein
MTLAPYEFVQRFLLHVLPHGFHRIHHYGLLATTQGAPFVGISAASPDASRGRLSIHGPPGEESHLPSLTWQVTTSARTDRARQ